MQTPTCQFGPGLEFTSPGLLQSGLPLREFTERVTKNATGQRLPGWYPHGTAPAPSWPPDTSHGSPA
ncbi:hypothetical protein [Mycobacterium novum]